MDLEDCPCSDTSALSLWEDLMQTGVPTHRDMDGNKIGGRFSVGRIPLNKVGVSRLLATFLSLIFFTNAGTVISLLFSHAIQWNSHIRKTALRGRETVCQRAYITR